MYSTKLVVTVNETAKMLGISRNSAYEGVRRGEIPSIRIGKRLLIPRLALEEMLGRKSENTWPLSNEDIGQD